MMARCPRPATLALGAAFALMIALGPPSEAGAGDSLVGEVTAVESANLITLDYGPGEYLVRISGIELTGDEALDREAAAFMSELLLGQTVRLRFEGRAPDGLMYGRILVSGIGRDESPVRDAGLELVRAGLARGDDDGYKYQEMTRAELEARSAQRGLWE